jgi:hypothetical protein
MSSARRLGGDLDARYPANRKSACARGIRDAEPQPAALCLVAADQASARDAR